MTKLYHIVSSKTFLFLCMVLIVIDLLFPLTFTVDTGHFFSYLKVLNGDVPFNDWDPVRGVIFPLFLKIVVDVFGKTLNSLLIPLIFFHLFLFLLSSYLVITPFNSLSLAKQKLIIYFVFLFIAIDPLILGFYHTVLTEFLASSIALLSCFFSLLFFINIKNNRSLLVFFCTFFVIVPVSWHLKQPYVGAALFPMVLVSFLVIVEKKEEKNVKLKMAVGNILVLFSLGISIYVWDQILPSQATQSQALGAGTGSNIFSYLNVMSSQNLEQAEQSPFRFAKDRVKNYLALSNIYFYDLVGSVAENFQYTNEIIIKKDFSLTRTVENGAIGYRMYEGYGQSNIFYMSEGYKQDILSYESLYYPPKWLNFLLGSLTIKSTVLFSLLYLILPFTFCVVFLLLIINQRRNAGLIIIFLCSGSAFFNAVVHSFINNPIDRYLFWGYPLLLVSLLVSFFSILFWLQDRLVIILKTLR